MAAAIVVEMKVRDGNLTVEQWIELIALESRPTRDDMAYLLDREIGMIVKRTKDGIDADGAPFHPYSQKGPIYIYPNNAGVRSISHEKRRAAAVRFAKKIGAPRPPRGRIGIKFDSYEDYKFSGLGRSNVDLAGPHYEMLRAIQRGRISMGAELSEGEIGIYDDEKATIAQAHDEGAMTGRNHKVKLPRRHFWDINDGEFDTLLNEYGERVFARLDNL